MFRFSYFFIKWIDFRIAEFYKFWGELEISSLHGLVITEAKRGHAAQLSKGSILTSSSGLFLLLLISCK